MFFRDLMKPQVYNWIHDSIHEVIHVDYKDLMQMASLFSRRSESFLKWCGEEYVLSVPGEIRMLWNYSEI